MYCCALAVIGAISVAVVAVRVLCFVKLNYMTSLNMKKRYAKAGEWAVVTGASEGIGRGMSIDLARRGFNVCVIARTQSKLDAVAAEIKAIGVQAKSISFDFANATPETWKTLFNELDTISIGVLVNNVGVNYEYTNYIYEVDEATDLRMIKVNCEATLRMTKYVVPKMRERHSGAILCLGSVSALTPAPMLATYAGTKSFNISFAEALHYELKRDGIDVLAVAPNMVISLMTQGKSSRKPKATFMFVDAEQMAHDTLNKLGSVSCTAGHRNHTVLEAIMKALPVSFVSKKILAMHQGIKKRAERQR